MILQLLDAIGLSGEVQVPVDFGQEVVVVVAKVGVVLPVVLLHVGI